MKKYIAPLSVHFIWHASDSGSVKPLVDYCVERLQRDSDNPFSRSLNIPVFLRVYTPGETQAGTSYASLQSMAFLFLSRELADAAWNNYVADLSKENIRIVPVAVDRSAISAKTAFSKLHFIRLYDFQSGRKEPRFFIAAAHEVYRFTLNPQYDAGVKGKENAVRLFLSHTKADTWAVALANKLKNFIDKSSMRNFFDATDIAPAYRFDKEIRSYLQESTLISIHSDSYFSRYWCQLEILCSKKELRPIVAVDHLKESEDRTFPHAGNVPAVHISAKITAQEKELYYVLESALIETVRFFHQVKLLRSIRKPLGLDKNTLILARPPEPSDLTRILILKKGKIQRKVESVLYPEPPVYPDELKFLGSLGIKATTPLTAGRFDLHDCAIGLSISDVDDVVSRGQLPSNQIKLFAQDVARHLLARGAKLVYGGDLRKDGFTEFLFSEAAALKDRLPTKSNRILNYISWPIYLKDTDEVKRWKTDYSYVATMKEIQPPKSVSGLIGDRGRFLKPSTPVNRYIWAQCLTSMRRTMIDACDVRISAGGRLTGYKGKYPGVLEEIAIAIEMGKPLYLLGAYGGVTQRICEMLTSGKTPKELTVDWQKTNNTRYEHLIEEFERHGTSNRVAYENLEGLIRKMGMHGLCKLNNLTKTENLRLFQTPFTEEAILLILQGIRRDSRGSRRKR